MLTATVHRLDGTELHRQQRSFDLPADSSAFVAKGDFVVPHGLTGEVLFVRLTLANARGDALSQEDYVFGVTGDPPACPPLQPLLEAPPTQVALDLNNDNHAVRAANVGSSLALFVELRTPADALHFEDNHFCLLPGERRTVRLLRLSDDAPSPPRIVAASGWNTPVARAE